MPATFVTTAELRANLGIGSLYSDAYQQIAMESLLIQHKQQQLFTRTLATLHRTTSATQHNGKL